MWILVVERFGLLVWFGPIFSVVRVVLEIWKIIE